LHHSYSKPNGKKGAIANEYDNRLSLEDFSGPLLNTGAIYDFTLRPSDVPNLESSSVRGTNCIIVAHHVAAILGKPLRSDLLLTELYSDTEYVEGVEPHATRFQQGDFIFLGQTDKGEVDDFIPIVDQAGYQRNWHENPLNHLVVATGYTESDGDPLILHAAPGVNTEIIPLSRLMTENKYRKIHGVRRLIDRSGIVPNP